MEVGVISTALKKKASKIRLSAQWQGLHDSYGIGRCEGKWLYLTRQNLKSLQDLVIAQVGIDPTKEGLSGNRTEVSKRVKNEKWSTTAARSTRIYCSALNGPLALRQGTVEASPEVEYCIDYQDIQIAQYDAIMVIENLEAYIFSHSFCFPEIGKVLLVYRGHDQSARAVQDCLKTAPEGMLVYYFTDPDPSGIGIIIDSPFATHAIVPAFEAMQKKDSLTERFADQLAARPNLRGQVASYPINFQGYAEYILNQGIAISQEWLCSHAAPLQSIHLR